MSEAERPLEPKARLVALPPEIEADMHAGEKRRAAEEALPDVDEGVVRRPTRAEAVLALLWAAVLAPAIAIPLGALVYLVLGEKLLEKISKKLGGHAGWPLMVFGTAFAAIFVGLLLPKLGERRASRVRVLVFERGRSFGPSFLLLVVLIEIGAIFGLLIR